METTIKSPVTIESSAGSELKNSTTAIKSASDRIALAQAKAIESEHSRTLISNEISNQRTRLQEAIAMLNERINSSNKNLAFQFDEASNRIVISIVNKVSGEVVRQIPDASVLKIARNIESMKGILFEDYL